MSGAIVSPGVRARVRAMIVPIATGLARIGLTPNALTLIGFGIAAVAAVVAALGAWIPAALLVSFGGVFDLFDGAVARATGTVTRLGGFLDSTFDRWGEGAVFIGIAWASMAVDDRVGAILAMLAMTSAFMVSYTRARSESLGFVTGAGMAAVGLAPREVRIVIVTLGLLAAGITGQVAVQVAMGLLAVLATITTIQRIVHTARQAAAQQG